MPKPKQNPIARACMVQGITAAELARMLGCNRSFSSAVINGKKGVSFRLLIALHEIFRKTVSYEEMVYHFASIEKGGTPFRVPKPKPLIKESHVDIL